MLNQIIIALIEGITAFIGISIDDLVILLIFFAQVKDNKKIIRGCLKSLLIRIVNSE